MYTVYTELPTMGIPKLRWSLIISLASTGGLTVQYNWADSLWLLPLPGQPPFPCYAVAVSQHISHWILCYISSDFAVVPLDPSP